jgi:putative transposase
VAQVPGSRGDWTITIRGPGRAIARQPEVERGSQAGETCSKHRVARLMRVNSLRALHRDRMLRWSVGKPAVLIPNLLQRQFTVTRRNKALVTDIIYIHTWQGWLYLAVVMDLFSRKIVGWARSPAPQGMTIDIALSVIWSAAVPGDLSSSSTTRSFANICIAVTWRGP